MGEAGSAPSVRCSEETEWCGPPGPTKEDGDEAEKKEGSTTVVVGGRDAVASPCAALLVVQWKREGGKTHGVERREVEDARDVLLCMGSNADGGAAPYRNGVEKRKGLEEALSWYASCLWSLVVHEREGGGHWRGTFGTKACRRSFRSEAPGEYGGVFLSSSSSSVASGKKEAR